MNPIRYETTKTVTPHMTDSSEVCRPGEVLRFMQEAAFDQLETLGPSMDYLASIHRAFLISRISMDILYAPVYGDTLTAVSYPSPESRGFCFDRNYQLLKADGTQAARAISQWAMVDMESRKLLRVDDCGIDYRWDEPVETVIPLRFRIPKTAALTDAGEKVVRYTDCDMYGHFNNTRYADLCTDFLPLGYLPAHRVTSMAIAFLREAPIGTVLKVTRTEPDEEGMTYLRTYLPEGEINMEAAVRCTTV